MPAIDPICFDSDRGGDRQLWVLFPSGTLLQLTNDADSWSGQPSANAAWIPFLRSPDGSLPIGAAYTQADLWTYCVGGATETLLIDASAQSPDAWTFLATPHYSPSGLYIVARTIAGEAVRPTVIHNLSTGGCDVNTITVDGDLDYDAGASLTDASWHPVDQVGGPDLARAIYCRQGSLVYREWNYSTDVPSGPRTTLFDATAWDPNVGDPNDQGRVWCYDPVYSPGTGNNVAFLCDFNGFPSIDPDSDWGVAICDDDGTDPYRVTPDDAIYSKPEWSSDGLWIYCHRYAGGGTVELVQVPADGSAVATPGLVEVLLSEAGVYSEYPARLAVAEPENPPEATNGSDSICVTDEPIPLTINLVDLIVPGTGDGDPNTWTYTIDTDPGLSTLEPCDPPAVGCYEYTPPAGFEGTDTFTWHADDGTGPTDIVTFTINITDCTPIPVGPAVPTLPTLGQCNVLTVTLHHADERAYLTFSSGRDQIDSYDWSRTGKAISAAQVTVPLSGTVDDTCCDLLATVMPWRDTMRVWRDETEVWRGPVRRPTYERTHVTISARDGAAWLERRRIAATRNFNAADAGTVWARTAQEALAVDWPAFLKITPGEAGHVIERKLRAEPWVYAARELADIAGDLVDWAVIVGDIRVASALRDGAPTVRLRDEHFLGDLQIVRDGDAYASWYGVIGGNGIHASAGGTDPAMGLVEQLTESSAITTQGSANAYALAGWAVRGADGVPLVLAMSNVAFAPGAPVSPDLLVPGRIFDVNVGPSCLQIATRLRLVGVRVSGDAERETITPTFEPVGAISTIEGN